MLFIARNARFTSLLTPLTLVTLAALTACTDPSSTTSNARTTEKVTAAHRFAPARDVLINDGAAQPDALQSKKSPQVQAVPEFIRPRS
jgi:hypothetical protein